MNQYCFELLHNHIFTLILLRIINMRVYFLVTLSLIIAFKIMTDIWVSRTTFRRRITFLKVWTSDLQCDILN
jgi:hypothetical protein